MQHPTHNSNANLAISYASFRKFHYVPTFSNIPRSYNLWSQINKRVQRQKCQQPVDHRLSIP